MGDNLKERIQKLSKAATGYRDAHERFLKGKIERGDYYTAKVRFEAEANLSNVLALIAEIERLQEENAQVREDRDELSNTIESCHSMLDRIDPDHEEGMTTLTPLDTRLREHLFSEDVITDDDVNGDD